MPPHPTVVVTRRPAAVFACWYPLANAIYVPLSLCRHLKPCCFLACSWPIKPTAYISVNDPNHALPLVLFVLLKNTSCSFRHNEGPSRGCPGEHRRTNTVPAHTPYDRGSRDDNAVIVARGQQPQGSQARTPPLLCSRMCLRMPFRRDRPLNKLRTRTQKQKVGQSRWCPVPCTRAVACMTVGVQATSALLIRRVRMKGTEGGAHALMNLRRSRTVWSNTRATILEK